MAKERNYDTYFKDYLKKYKRIQIRVLPAEYELYKEAQEKSGSQSMRAFIREAILQRAREILGKKNVEKRLEDIAKESTLEKKHEEYLSER